MHFACQAAVSLMQSKVPTIFTKDYIIYVLHEKQGKKTKKECKFVQKKTNDRINVANKTH